MLGVVDTKEDSKASKRAKLTYLAQTIHITYKINDHHPFIMKNFHIKGKNTLKQ